MYLFPYLVFNFFLLSKVLELYSDQKEIITIFLVVIMSILTGLILFQVMEAPWKQLNVVLGYFTKMFKIIYVPCLYVGLVFFNEIIFQKETDILSVILESIYILETIFVIIFFGGFTYLEIKPFRHQNILWRFSNNQELI